jgi:hypothetical protein
VAKTWVLETSTKGTGATVVPLRDAGDAPAGDRDLALVAPAPRQRPQPAPAPAPAPRRFRVVDVVTRETLADDASTRETVEALGTVRSVVDVAVSVRDEAHGRWRLLTRREQDALWRHRRPAAD